VLATMAARDTLNNSRCKSANTGTVVSRPGVWYCYGDCKPSIRSTRRPRWRIQRWRMVGGGYASAKSQKGRPISDEQTLISSSKEAVLARRPRQATEGAKQMSEASHIAHTMNRLFFDANNGWRCPFTEAITELSSHQAAWTPVPGMNSIWALVNHIRIEEEVALLRLRGLPVDYASLGDKDGWPPAGPSDDEDGWHQACERAIAVHQELTAAIAALTDAELLEPYHEGWPNRWYVLQCLMDHTGYHTGQIVMLRRLQGSWRALQWLPSS